MLETEERRRRFLKAGKDSSAFIFYSLNILLLVVALYVWHTYSILRVVILYSIFNMILFRLSAVYKKNNDSGRSILSADIFRLLAMLLVVLLAGTAVGSYESLYARPWFVTATTGLTIMLFVVIVLVSSGERVFKESFALLAAISIVVLSAFGIYLAQPNLTNSPAYATVDAYRDYANAVRISSSSRMDPDIMVLTPYYRAFPVVPLIISNASLVAAVPLSISHLILGTIADAVAVASLFALSKRIAGNHGRDFSCLLFLPVLLVYLQPMMMDPAMLLMPLRMSVPIVSMILYLAYPLVLGSRPTRSVAVALMLLVMIVVPLHMASTVLVILFLGMMTIAGSRRARTSLAVIEMLAITLLFLYVFFSAGGPYDSVLQMSRAILMMINDMLGIGATFPAEIASRLYVSRSISETSSFLQSIVPALLLSIFTTFVAKLAKERRKVLAEANQRSLYIMLGVLLLIAFGMSQLSPLWKVDARYFTYPLTPVAVMTAAMVILWVVGDRSARRRLLVAGLLSLCVASMLIHPSYLESNPSYLRLMPIESERDAAMFVSTEFDAQTGDVTQIVSDWPYYPEVQGLLYSSHIGIEDKVYFPALMFNVMAPCQETMILSRRYYIENENLQLLTPYVQSLADNRTWSHFNRIYDVYSVSIHVGRLSC
jgi:hypothetical protein